MIPVTQFILGNSDPLLYPSEKMTNSIGCRGGMRNRIGYDTYDTYGRSTNKNDREEKILTMLMSGGYNDDGYHFNEYEAKEVVEHESAITFWFKDVDFDGDKVWEYFHMNN